MVTNELNEQKSLAEVGLHQNGPQNPNRRKSPENDWDESYGQRFTESYHLKPQDAEDESSDNPEVSEADSNQSENQRNQDPTRNKEDQDVTE